MLFYVWYLFLGLVASCVAGIGMELYAQGNLTIGNVVAMAGHVGVWAVVGCIGKKMEEAISKRASRKADQA